MLINNQNRQLAIFRDGLFCTVVFTLLSGCTGLSALKPLEPAPGLTLPSTWRDSAKKPIVGNDKGDITSAFESQAGTLPGAQWWVSLEQPALTALMQAVTTTSPDLDLATLRLQRTKMRAHLEESDYPIRFSPSGSVSASASAAASGIRSDFVSYSGVASASVELDLFGRVASSKKLRDVALKSSEVDYKTIVLLHTITAAASHWQMGLYKEQLNVAQNALQVSARTLSISQARFAQGLIAGIEMRQAETAFQSQQLSIQRLRQVITVQRDALAQLLGNAPGTPAPNFELDALPAMSPPPLPADIPALVLARRPDIANAERELTASLLVSNLTRSSFYPSLIISANGGVSSSQLVKLLRDPVGTLSAQLALPFLESNKIARRADIAALDYQEAVINFKKRLYLALAEVENVLSEGQQLRKDAALLAKRTSNTIAIERANKIRYENGLIKIRDYLDAQQAVQDAQLSQSQNRYAQFINFTRQIQALGGGVE